MQTFSIEGGHVLHGKIKMHGAKNAALPILAATLLCPSTVIENCPKLSDVEAAMRILQQLGCAVVRTDSTVRVVVPNICSSTIPDEYMREMRSSIVFLGAILAKCGNARVSFPGGCELGPRPIDLHLASLEKLGASITENHGYLDCTVPNGLHGAEITLPFPSVGATENIILAAVTATGKTTIRNAAREPEIIDLIGYLCSCGADIHIEADSTVVICGKGELLSEGKHSVIPDRIATATYLCAAAAAGGKVTITDCCPHHLAAVLPYFEEMGCTVNCGESSITLERTCGLRSVKSVRTMPYPGFPTDAQSPLMAVTAVADGTSVFVENIFENRYKHVSELMRMGARIKVEGRVAVVEGVPTLHSAELQCTDLRGGAALCIAALAASGTAKIDNIKHIDRGYEDFENKLRQLGAVIVRE